MSIPDNQKLDFLWKKLGYGATKTDLNSIKGATNEAIPSPLLLRGDRLWSDSNLIPAVMPSTNTNVVEVYSPAAAVECDMDLTSTQNRTWKTNLIDWIPPEFGSTYQVKVYIANSGANPTTGAQIFAAGSGNDDEWFFDYQAGLLHFIGNNLPSGISGKKIFISGARYTGTFGTSGAAEQVQLDSINDILDSLQNFEYAGHTTSEMTALLSGSGGQEQIGIIYNENTGKYEPQKISTASPGAFLQFYYSDGTRDDINMIATYDGSEVISAEIRFWDTNGNQDNINMV